MVAISIDPYKTLGVDRDATLTEIRTSYRKLVLKCHPDKVVDPALKLEKQDEFQRVQGAYELLSDPAEREKYDKIRRDQLHAAFAAASVPPQDTTTPRSPPKYSSYHSNANVRTAEPPRPFFTTANAASSSSKMYAQTAPKSWEEIRVPDDLHKTARRAASYDERSSNGKREEERRRRRDLDEEPEEPERDHRRHWEKEQRKAEKEDARKAEEKRLKKERKREKREAEDKKTKPRSYADDADEDGLFKGDKKKSSSTARGLEKDAKKPEKVEKADKADKAEKKDKERDRDRERDRERERDRDRERERDPENRERSLSEQRRESAEEKQSRALENAMNYIKTSQSKATPILGRANTYTSGVSYVTPPPIVPMPPVDEEEARRSSVRARRGSQESRTKEKPSSSKKGPTLDPLADEAPYIVVDAVPPPMSRRNLPRANTATDREFTTRTAAEIPMPSPPRRAETFHYSNNEREAEPRGRNRSRHQPQVNEEDESDDDYRREPKNQSRRGSRARSPEMAPPRDYPYTTVYTVNDGRSRREGSFRTSPERNYAKPAYTYVQPVMSNARAVDPRTIDPRSREPYAVPSSKIRFGKNYTKDDINYGPGFQEGWGGVRA